MSKGRDGKLAKRFNEAQTQLVTQTADLSLGTLADLVHGGSIDLEPAFQRRERWDVTKQSALIESFLLNVPVPPIYLSEEANGTYTAIDGKQRLRAITEFMTSNLSLQNLERMTEAEGCYFRDFPEIIQNPLKIRPFLRVVTLLKQSDASLKYEVFLRLNRGGEALNPQEIRNVAFRGPLNDLIYELAKSGFLRSQLKITSEKSVPFRNMEDAELVLRFLTLHDRFGRFSGSLIREMDDFLRKRRNDKHDDLTFYKDLFVDTLGRVKRIWGEFAFKRPEKDGWRNQLLAGMYDAQMLAASHMNDQEMEHLAAKSKSIIEKTRLLFSDRAFEEAVRTGTNTPQRIAYRVEQVEALLKASSLA